jgi:hypothetical protein
MRSVEANIDWRTNFFRCDGPGYETQRRLLSWSPVHSDTHSFHSPRLFGVIRFVKKRQLTGAAADLLYSAYLLVSAALKASASDTT